MKTYRDPDIRSGTTDKVEGSAKVLSGKVKEATGRAVRSPKLESKGVSEQLEGHAQKKVGAFKKAIGL